MRKGMSALAVGLGLLVAGSAMAKSSKGSVLVDVNSPTSVAGKALPAGEYSISWKADGDSATVTFKSRAAKVEAEVKARVESRPNAASDNAVVSRGANGSKAVSEVRLRGKKDVLVFESAS